MASLPSADPPLAPQRTPAGLFAAGIAGLLPIAFSPNVNAFFWTPRLALLCLVAAVGAPRLVILLRDERSRGAAMAGAGFLVAAAVSTVLSENVDMSAWGLYGFGNGLVFVLALVGVWALGSTIPRRSQLDVMLLLVVGGCLNAVVGLVQTVVDLSEYHLALFPGGRAAAFLGNPVHLGAVSVACFALVARQWVNRSLIAVVVLVLLASGVQISGSRFALGVAALVVIATAMHTWRRAFVVLACLLAGLGLGEVVARAGDQLSSTTRAQVAVASGTEARVQSWLTARHAVADRPLFGAGPGQFRAATSQYRTERISRAEGADRLFYDAHNTFVEYVVTTGIVGLVLYAVWLALIARRARGPFLWFAAGMLCLHLVQPHSLATTPLLFLSLGAALGAAPMTEKLPWPLAATTVAAGVAATAAATALLVGDFRLDQARLDFTLSDAESADRFLPSWPEVAEIESRIWLFESIRANDDAAMFERALVLRRETTDRDDAPIWWIERGELELASRDPGRAELSLLRAIELDPQSVRARAGLAELAMRQRDYDRAETLLAEARRKTRHPIDLELLSVLDAKLERSRT